MSREARPSTAEIPVFITYRDRLTMLKTCVDSLLARGFRNLTVIDNDSMIPLKDVSFFADHPSISLHWGDNTYRHVTPWAEHLVPTDSYYIVMDCDIELDCPDDVLDYLLDKLAQRPDLYKIGLGIRVDDLPQPAPRHYEYSFDMEFKVVDYPIENALRIAPIDTHFAIYRPGATEWGGISGARTMAPYLCRHLSWYNESFTKEEELYYSRTGNEWARTHSAESLVPLPVVVGFTSLSAKTVVSLGGQTVLYRPLLTDEDYFALLAEQVTNGDSFVNVEQDIVLGEHTLEELRSCQHDWCAMPYHYRGDDKAYGLGCTKLSHRLIARHPDLMEVVGKMQDAKHPPRHWCRLDAWIYQVLTQRGEIRHEHDNPVEHLGGQRSTHGCAE